MQPFDRAGNVLRAAEIHFCVRRRRWLFFFCPCQERKNEPTGWLRTQTEFVVNQTIGWGRLQTPPPPLALVYIKCCSLIGSWTQKLSRVSAWTPGFAIMCVWERERKIETETEWKREADRQRKKERDREMETEKERGGGLQRLLQSYFHFLLFPSPPPKKPLLHFKKG